MLTGQEAWLGECAEALRRRNSDLDHLQVSADDKLHVYSRGSWIDEPRRKIVNPELNFALRIAAYPNLIILRRRPSKGAEPRNRPEGMMVSNLHFWNASSTNIPRVYKRPAKDSISKILCSYLTGLHDCPVSWRVVDLQSLWRGDDGERPTYWKGKR
jgi:hypothetical protein